jgi:dihydrofolate reductase
MMTSVFVGTSVDGFIARANDDLDWLPPEGNPSYSAFIATVDAIVMGRRTFEKVLSFGAWPYGGTPVFVLSSRALRIASLPGAVIEQLSGAPQDVVARLAARGVKHLYVDGGVTIQRFLREGLIQRLIVTRVPVLIGDGIPLFGALPRDIRLTHVATREHPGGLVETEYAVGT